MASGSEGMMRIFRPIQPGVGRTLLFEAAAGEEVETASSDISLQRFSLDWYESRADSARSEWYHSFSYSGFNISGDLLLPDSGVLVDDLLQDVELGLGCRGARADDIYGCFASIGSASDRPFDSLDETSLMLNAFYKLARNPASAWMLMLNYSNRRSFLPNIPLPGAAYVYNPDRRTVIIAGMPFFLARYPLTARSEISARYFVPDQIKIESNTRLADNLELLAGVERDEESYFLAGRANREDRLYYEETRLYAGFGWRPESSRRIELTLGYALDRRFYQGEDSDERDRDRVGVEDGFDLGITCFWVF